MEMTDIITENARKYWCQHLGTVDLIFADGFIITKPIGAIIRGMTRVMADGSVVRYIDYKINANQHVAKSLNAVEQLIFMQWMRTVEMGLDKLSPKNAWRGAEKAYKQIIKGE